MKYFKETDMSFFPGSPSATI